MTKNDDTDKGGTLYATKKPHFRAAKFFKY